MNTTANLERKENTEIFLEVDKGEYIQIDMNLPLKMLFDDVMTFVSKADF